MGMNRVLIVDDDARIGRIIKRIATKLRLEASVIGDPDAFESEYLTYEPDLIFMDLQMPRYDGIELLRKLAQNNSTASVVLMSGVDKCIIATASEVGKSLGLSMSETLSKPICIDNVEKLLVQHFDLQTQQSKKPATAALTDSDLRRAIDRDEFVVYYEPQIRLDTGAVSGAAAVVRWNHPERGFLLPASFIPIAEAHQELIERLTYKVLEIAISDDERRREQNIELKLSIGLSTNLLSDLALPDKIMRILDAHSFDPSRLVLEITERAAMTNLSQTMDILTRLRLKNIGLSLDNFGTGFSSLIQIRRMPFNQIRVGKSFSMRTGNHREAAELSRVTIGLGHSLGLEVVAEGVADEHTYDWLRLMGCEMCQGTFIGKPADPNTFSEWVGQHNTDLAAHAG